MQEQSLTALNRPITCVSTYQSSLSITCNNAIEFCFQSEFGDALGWKEFRKKLLESSDIEERFLSERWVANHYRWIVWKQASLERKFPHVCKGEYLNPRSVLEQLKKRYKREVGDGARSALRLVLEGDSPPNLLMVLVVNSVIKIENGSADKTLKKENEIAPQQSGSTTYSIQMELSDGWYCIRAMFDNSVANLLENNVLQVGMKIAVQQSQLVNWTSGINPLDCACNNVHDFSSGNSDPKLLISKNSSRITAWDMKLGFQRRKFFTMDLSTFDPLGGVTGCVEVLVERVYPMVYVERHEDGTSTFRSETGERHAQENFERRISSLAMNQNSSINGGNSASIGGVMHKRNVNPIFQADVIDAKNGMRHSASITFWKASEELRTKLMETRRWRFFGLIPSNRGSDNDESLALSIS